MGPLISMMFKLMIKTVFKNKKALWIALMALLVPGSVAPVFGQQVQVALAGQAQSATNELAPSDELDEPTVDYSSVPQFGGPTSVGAQVKSDNEVRKTPYWIEGISQGVQPYYDFKARVQKNHGLSFGADYNLLYQGASESLGEDSAAGSVLRLYGTWTLAGRGSQDMGAITFKVENRHHLGTDIAPQQLGGEVGYAGLTAITYSDAGSLLTNLYWQQSFNNNRLAFVAGIVDVTDYVAVYGLVNPWTDFINLVFSTDPTIPVPNQGLGAAVRTNFADNYYILVGLADANGDPGEPQDSFDSFFNDHEYFKHIELGWFSSWENRFTDNIHLTAWQVDEREAALVPNGWGAAFSFSRKFNDRWLPFVRAGYSDGGGVILERSVSVGVGYFMTTRSDEIGVGLNWGRPSEKTFGPDLDDQYTAEMYYRFQLFQHVSVTPDFQYLANPALNLDEDSIWVAGLRARVVF